MNNKPSVPGPATSLIDFGYRVKAPLSEAVDAALGIPKGSPASLKGFLDACYEVRRPGFVFIDECTGWVPDPKKK